MLKEHVGSIDFKVKGCVLIIVLMEHAQRETERIHGKVLHLTVLILILMEHAQRVASMQSYHLTHQSLNPYFNGTFSKRW